MRVQAFEYDHDWSI